MLASVDGRPRAGLVYIIRCEAIGDRPRLGSRISNRAIGDSSGSVPYFHVPYVHRRPRLVPTALPGLRPANTAALQPEGLILDLLTEGVSESPVHHLSLLKGLSEDEAARLLDEAVILQAHSGDRIIRQGDRDDTLYALLYGTADVCLDRREEEPITVLAGGDTFGEIGLVSGMPRSVNVIARLTCDVLVL